MTRLAMEVVDIRKVNSDGALRAFADVKIGDSLIVKGFSVFNGKNGIFVSMPKKVGKEGKWFEVLTPLSDQFRQEIEEKVLEAYDKEVDGVSN